MYYNTRGNAFLKILIGNARVSGTIESASENEFSIDIQFCCKFYVNNMHTIKELFI